MNLPLPVTLYIGTTALFIGTIYNLINWNVMRYYLQCEYPEQSEKVMSLMVFNKALFVFCLIFFAMSPLLCTSVFELMATLLLAVPIALICWLFYKIFAHLHKKVATVQQEVK